MGMTEWNDFWDECLNKNQASFNNIHWSQRWNDDISVQRFNTHSINNQKNSKELILKIKTEKSFRVLEIGPGTGPVTIPLSYVVEHITAIEPSNHMATILKSNLETSHIRNVTVIQKRWEDIDLKADLFGMYDLVLASHSLGMNDLQSALQKMNDLSSRFVYLFWFFRSSFLEHHYIKLWPDLHGKEYSPLPKADVICQILLQMGIKPDVDIYETENIYRYENMDEAVDDISKKFGVIDDNKKDIIIGFIQKNNKSKDNGIIITGRSTNAKIWWQKPDHQC